MAGVWSYEGKRVLVSGGGGAGMGAAAVRDLLELGAEVHVFDVKEPVVGRGQLPDGRPARPAAIESNLADLGGPLDALFNCAGLPGPPFSGLDVMLVNFVAARHLTTLAAEHMAPGLGGLHDLLGRGVRLGERRWTRWHAAHRHPGLRRGPAVVRGAPRGGG